MRLARDPASAPLTRFEWLGLTIVLLLVVGFGGVTLVRSTYQSSRKTDLKAYTRAGYAVRTGEDIYAVDDDGMHYCYPPPFAIFMAPFADPGQGHDATIPCLPFGVIVVAWYAINLGLSAWCVHALACVVLPDAVPRSRRWWYARLVPWYAAIAGIGYTLARGQVNLILAALITGMFVAAIRGRTMRSGAYLAGAIAMKLIPAFLLLFPAARREWRAGVGVVTGLLVLHVALPVAVWGVDGAVQHHLRFLDVVALPGATGHGDLSRAAELTLGTQTDNQSIQSVVHVLRNPDPTTRLPWMDDTTRKVNWAAAVLLTGATVVAGWRRSAAGTADQLIFLGCLCTVMVLVSPVSHRHYAVLVLPLASGLWLKGMLAHPDRVTAGPGIGAVLAAWGIANVVVLLPGELATTARHFGLATFAHLGLWGTGVTSLLRAVDGTPQPTALPDDLPEIDQAVSGRRSAAA